MNGMQRVTTQQSASGASGSRVQDARWCEIDPSERPAHADAPPHPTDPPNTHLDIAPVPLLYVFLAGA